MTLAREAADLIGPHDIAVVLGSGWAVAADALGEPDTEWELPSLPGFLAPSVTGHGGTARSLEISTGARVLVLLGRTHLYEGHGPAAVVHGVRVAAAAGCRSIVLTNAAGAINPAYPVGQPVLLSDHLNLTGASPLVGASFVDLSECWSPHLRAVALGIDPHLPEGVYAGLAGPQYETPAEIRMLRSLGADLVGMSTVLEAIAAREAGLAALGISLVTNAAAGVTGEALDHHDVLAAGARSAERLGFLLAGVVAGIGV